MLTYQTMNRQITAPPELIQDTVRQLTKQCSAPRFKTVRRWRTVAIAVALVLCLAIGMPVLAANVQAVYDLMYSIAPAAAQLFQPVREACEDNGIRMEVVSVYIDGNTIQAYVAMTDLLGDRVDATTDLYDSYSIRHGLDASSNCERVSYDEDSHTALFCITMTCRGDARAALGSKMTFSVAKFLSHKSRLENIPLDIDLAQVETATETQPADDFYQRGSGGAAPPPDTVITPGRSLLTPADGFDITAIGLVDGKLHVQLRTQGVMRYDNHGYLVLQKGAGEPVHPSSTSFVVGEWDDPNRLDYEEFVFDVSPSELGNYRLYGNFYTSGMLTEGRWQVTFPMVNQETP